MMMFRAPGAHSTRSSRPETTTSSPLPSTETVAPPLGSTSWSCPEPPRPVSCEPSAIMRLVRRGTAYTVAQVPATTIVVPPSRDPGSSPARRGARPRPVGVVPPAVLARSAAPPPPHPWGGPTRSVEWHLSEVQWRTTLYQWVPPQSQFVALELG